jgi:hypothetical protein
MDLDTFWKEMIPVFGLIHSEKFILVFSPKNLPRLTVQVDADTYIQWRARFSRPKDM